MLQLLCSSALALSPHARGVDAVPRAAALSGPDATPNHVTPLLPHAHERARERSRVHLPGWNATELYSGFFTIDAATDSHTYFMFSTAASKRPDAPVILWLNGGPGASSLLGFYDEVHAQRPNPRPLRSPHAVGVEAGWHAR
jgi:carboxypeptidase C (cathepsin A)